MVSMMILCHCNINHPDLSCSTGIVTNLNHGDVNLLGLGDAHQVDRLSGRPRRSLLLAGLWGLRKILRLQFSVYTIT